MSSRIIAFLSGLLLSIATAFAEDSPAVEAWSDARLPVKAGLQVWLDAASQPAAYKAANQPEPASGEKMQTCFDASGHARHVTQGEITARPLFIRQNGYSAVRFNGENNFLSKPGLSSFLRDITIYVVSTPFSNSGGFRAFMAINQRGANDYQTGLNIDQGPFQSSRFESINTEGSGFGGVANLMTEPTPFGKLVRFAITSTPGKEGVRAFINGKPAGHRDRAESKMMMENLTIGARCYNHIGPAAASGFLDGDIAEVLIYDRVLSEKEFQDVDRYLSDKHGADRTIPIPAKGSSPLISVPDPPPVQMFVPGFSVHELPIKLTNVNNLKYRPDGKLVAVAYNGKIYLLTDTDGDGLEDHADLYWDFQGSMTTPLGVALAPANYGDLTMHSGLFIAGKSKVSLIADTDGADKADREVVLAEGWEKLEHGVDAMGVAYDPRDESVYFGLGAADFGNGYQIDKEGTPHYSLKSERGTILRIDAKTKEREPICTGVRFSVALAFNAAGDLFCTDQEGATWMPNGNPLDELLHIERGRHYGFPARHPKHLPGVIDEPSVCDYGPQHQSTCGLNFNEPINGGPIFGPKQWLGDAIVTGYSRGKLYRTGLVKTATGYVSSNQLLASLNMLTCDACVSPKGELVVCVHSGGPDWGSGPDGQGKLYKIRYAQPELAQPVAVWAQSPQEVHVAFDRPVNTDQLREINSQTKIEYGSYLAAGDRFESFRPGYAVVNDQFRSTRNALKVLGTSLTADRRTLILSTEPHGSAVNYALTLPGLGRPAETPKGELRQFPQTDLQYNLWGVNAECTSGDGSVTWRGWLPHLDTSVARAFTRGSATHDALWQMANRANKWKFDTSLNLWQMLRPLMQPGATLDHQWPEEEVTLTFRSPAKLAVQSPVATASTSSTEGGIHTTTLTFQMKQNQPVPVQVEFDATGPADLSVSFHTNEDTRERPLQLHRFLLPWARMSDQSAEPQTRQLPPELAGGNWSRGRRIFFSEQAACSKCHTVRGEGGKIGPNLSNLPHRDYASVHRDIELPSFAINPDHLAYSVVLGSGQILTGTLITEGDFLLVGDTKGTLTKVARSEVEEIKASQLSIMPEGIPKLLGPERMRDLMTYLLTPPPSMPLAGPTPPEPRARKEVEAVLAESAPPADSPRPLHVVLVAGPKDHGPSEHDYPAWQQSWKRLLSMADGVRVTTANDFPSNDDLKTADAIVFYQQGKWTADRAAAIDAFLARGGGITYLHYAVDGGADAPGFAERIGLAWRGGHSRFRHGELDLRFGEATHPIARNFKQVQFHDESYWQLVGNPSSINLIASGKEDDTQQPLLWTAERGQGRVFVSILGHFSWTFDDPLFRTLVLRGIAWSAKEPVDRFNELVTIGARVTE